MLSLAEQTLPNRDSILPINNKASRSCKALCENVVRWCCRVPLTRAVLLQVPGRECYSLCMYYALLQPLEQRPLLQRFVNETDAFRNSRFKLIPNIAQVSMPPLELLVFLERTTGVASMLEKCSKLALSDSICTLRRCWNRRYDVGSWLAVNAASVRPSMRQCRT